MTTHVSSFALDVWFADGKPAGELATHVASCDRCSGYVAELDALAGETPAPPKRPARAPRRFIPAAAGVLALAAALFLFVRSRPSDVDYVGIKGAPAVQLLVRGDGGTRVWDGRSPIHAGDALAIHVACEHLQHVTVAAPTASEMARLTDAECPSEPGPLPFTLVVDEAGAHERFSVVLTKDPPDDATLRELVSSSRRDRDVWVTTFDIPKERR